MRNSIPSAFGTALLLLVMCSSESTRNEDGDDDDEPRAGRGGRPSGGANGNGGSSGTIGAGEGPGGAPGGTTAGGSSGAAGADEGGSSGSGGTSGSGGNGCATKLGKEPVDLIIVADNSGSMLEELGPFETALNVILPAVFSEAAIDYRVILLTRHRRDDRALSEEASTSICVAAPLSGLAACPSEDPVFSARFYHYNEKVESADVLESMLGAYSAPSPDDLLPTGYGPWLRPGVKKAIVIVTDDDETTDPMEVLTPDAFLMALTALSPENFGAPQDGTTTVHSIVGIGEKANPTEVYRPDEPVVSEICTGNAAVVENAGPTYQALSVMTGGFRFPLCQSAGSDAIFRAIADSLVVDRDACDFAIPQPPSGVTLDLDAVVVTYSPGNSEPPVVLEQVTSLAECGTENAFYVENQRVFLCPEACSTLQSSSDGSVDIVFPCE